MLFWCTSLFIGGFRYRKREALLTSTFSTLAPPMDAKYYCNRFIAFHCHSSRKFRIRLASIAVANSDLFCIFAPPYSMTCIRLWFLNFQKWQTYVNNLSIPYRMPLVGSKSVHKRAGNTWSKKYLKFTVFAPLIGSSHWRHLPRAAAICKGLESALPLDLSKRQRRLRYFWIFLFGVGSADSGGERGCVWHWFSWLSKAATQTYVYPVKRGENFT